MLVLVMGAAGEDSGKTVLTASLVALLRREGLKTAPFKPYAATDAWLHPSIISEIQARKLVVTSDSLKLNDIAPELHPEIINPIALVLGRTDLSRNMWNPSPSQADPGLAGRSIIGRVSLCREGRVDTLHFINIVGLDRLPRGVRDAFIDAAASLKPYPLKVDDGFVGRVLTGEMNSSADSCLSRLLGEYDIVVVESNSDVPAPTPLSAQADIVLVAAPGVVGVINRERYRRGMSALNYTVGPMGGLNKVADLVRLTGVEVTVDLPFLDDPSLLYGRRDLEPILEKILDSV